jgi:hypothetical protein
MINFFKGLFWLAVILLQVYITQFTNLNKWYCFLITIPLAAVVAFVIGGFSKGKLFAKDSRGGGMISLTLGIYLIMQLILLVFTFLSFNER